jgi:uncharacterized protein YbjT (DUF2867 family)
MNVTIIGGHGKVALLLAPLLVEKGHKVRSVIRDPEQTGDVAATGAEPVVASVEEADLEDLTTLLTDQDAVVWSAGAGGGDPARTVAVDRDAAIRTMEAAQRAGAGRFVMVSFSGADPAHLVDDGDPFRTYQDAKIAADDHLRGTDLDWTILAPGALTLEPSSGRVNPAAGFRDGDQVSRALVAEVARAVLDDPRASRRTLVFGDGDTPVEAWLAAQAD